MAMIKRYSRAVSSILVLVVFALVWELLVRLFSVPEWLLPPPSAILSAMFLEAPLLLEALLVTFVEVVIGLLLALILGAGLAVLLSWTTWLERGIYPIVIGLQTLPILAITPLLIVWFGIGLGSKVAVVLLIAFFPIVVNLADGFRDVDRDMVNSLRLLGASKRQIFIKLKLPHALPFLFSGLKLAAVAAVVGALVGEWIASSSGLGFLIKIRSALFQTDVAFAAILVLMGLGVVMFLIVKMAGAWFVRNHAPKGGIN